MLTNNISKKLLKFLRSDLGNNVKTKVINNIWYILEHTDIEGTKDGFKIVFKKKI